MPTATAGSHRASALPPDERRAAIVAAALPLLLERGVHVTTRQIADAAGIAEGTIFRVFPDKDALLRAVIDTALDTSTTEAAIGAIDRTLPFERQLEAAVEILQRRFADIWRLVSAVADSEALKGAEPRPPADLTALADLFVPERRRLRQDPVRCARALRAATMASSHPALYPDEPMSPEEIVSLLLDGIRTRPSRARTTAPPPTIPLPPTTP
jgi:AcrR family transcriptional regulator